MSTTRCPGPWPAESAGPHLRPLCRIRSQHTGNDPGPTILGGAGGVAQLAERYVRNVEAEGSSPFTSTKGPGQKLKVESPRI